MFAPVSAAVCRRQPKQVSSTLSHISYSVILFFFLGERAAVCIWIWTRTVTQLSGERRGRNIQANNRSRQMHNLFFSSFVFPKQAWKHTVPRWLSHTIISPQRTVLPSLIYPSWQLFGPNVICGCWFWSLSPWEWDESAAAARECVMNLLHLDGILHCFNNLSAGI